MTADSQVNQAPVCIVEPVTQRGASPYEARWSARRSYDPEGDSLEFFWTPRNGCGTVGGGPEFVHIFPNKGTYYGNVVCVDPEGLTGWAGFETHVYGPWTLYVPFVSK